jgi:hypothetical protein
LLVTGWLLAWPTGRRAGLESLIAHALVGLIVQAMKHVIGRPRPRFAHGDNGFYLGPSFDVGLDSFPSGHAAATFAVASVLAKHFPGSRSLFYAMAALIAVSRVTRGSHFPTDVTAGVIVGILTGFLVSHLTEAAWKLRFSDLLIELATYLTVVFGLLWTVMHQVSDQVVWTLMVWTGVAAMAVGVSVRLHEKLRAPSDTDAPRVRLSAPNKLIAVGLALTTGSILVAILVMAAGVARWARDRTPEGGSVHLAGGADTVSSSWARKLWGEMPVIIGLAVMALAIQTLRGLLPIM